MPETVFVLAIWLLAASMGVAYSLRFAVNMPLWDDFNIVPLLTGEESPSWAWFWHERGGHRAPLPWALAYSILKLSGNDFRAVAVFNQAAIAVAVLFVVWAVWRRRGGARFTDAVFPLALMHWGTAISLLRTVLISGSVLIVLVCFVLALTPAAGRRPGRRDATLLAACSLLLALSTTVGAILGALLAIWILATFRDAAGPGGHWFLRAPRMALGLTLLSLAVIALGVLGHGGTTQVRDGGFRSTSAIAVALQVLGQFVGPAGSLGWVDDGIRVGWPPLFSVLAVLLAIGTLLKLLLDVRAAGSVATGEGALIALLGGILATACLVGLARSQLGSHFGLQNHYGIFAAPLAVSAYLAWDARMGEDPPLGRFVRMALFSLCCSLFVFNAEVGWRFGLRYRASMDSFISDVRGGVSDGELARRHVPFLTSQVEELERNLGRMRRAGLAPFSADGR